MRPQELSAAGRLAHPVPVPAESPEFECPLPFEIPPWESLDPLEAIAKPLRYQRMPAVDVGSAGAMLFKDIPVL